MRHSERSAEETTSPLLFLVFVIAGGAYILSAKFGGFPPLAVTAVPVLVMVLYALAVALVPRLRLRPDQAGDNLYYMGFLFTLTSLGTALYQFDPDGPSELILQNFGIAIASTVAGVLLRSVFNQMRRDPVEIEQVSRLELANAARRVRRELDATALEFSQFRRGMQQSISDAFEEVRLSLQGTSARILSDVSDLTEKAAKPIASASESSGSAIAEMASTLTETLAAASASSAGILESLSQKVAADLEKAAERLSSENDRLSASSGRIAAALDETSARLAAMQTPDRVVQIELEPLTAKFAAALDRIAERLDGQRGRDEETFGPLAAALRETNERALAIVDLRRAVDALVAAQGERGAEAVAAAAVAERQTLGLERLERALEASGARELRLIAAIEALGARLAEDRAPARPQPVAEASENVAEAGRTDESTDAKAAPVRRWFSS